MLGKRDFPESGQGGRPGIAIGLELPVHRLRLVEVAVLQVDLAQRE